MSISQNTIIENAFSELNFVCAENTKYFCPYEYDFLDKDLGKLCRMLHGFLNESFEDMNNRANNQNPCYLAANSRYLIVTLGVISYLIDGLRSCGLDLTVDRDYLTHIAFCNSFLRKSGGSPIPHNYTKISIKKFSPIFFLSNFSGNKIKNIIFGSVKKPDIFLTDALENNIEIYNKDENILIYDLPIKNGTVTIGEIKKWWGNQKHQGKFTEHICKNLNQVESNFFKAYYKYFNEDNCPALFAQVHLHYDPKTIKQLVKIEGKRKRLTFQRMDFLILYNNHRIIIEIDGVEHYSENSIPSPQKYAEQVCYDRKMKFLGYDIFRIGGFELTIENFEKTTISLFKSLKERFFNK